MQERKTVKTELRRSSKAMISRYFLETMMSTCRETRLIVLRKHPSYIKILKTLNSFTNTLYSMKRTKVEICDNVFPAFLHVLNEASTLSHSSPGCLVSCTSALRFHLVINMRYSLFGLIFVCSFANHQLLMLTV